MKGPTMNIERMITIVCGMIEKECGVNPMKIANATPTQIKNELLARLWQNDQILFGRKGMAEIVEGVKRDFAVDKIDWSDRP